jgi:glutamine---fructose-6-phosphate transaminase (isomerizing)
MCSVVGYIGKSHCSTFIFEGLARLEYRGYDAAGFACLDSVSKGLVYAKASGQLFNLTERIKKKPIDGFSGIGHTRWSTHGDVSEENAHPHFDCTKTISVVHNGIIENHYVLKNQLKEAGHFFYSRTDTEVIAHLFESFISSTESFKDAVCSVVNVLEGTYSFVVLLQDFPDLLVAVRKRSPLCVGFGDGEMFIASDVIAFAGKTDKVFFLPDESFALVTKDAITVFDFAGNELPIITHILSTTFENCDKIGFQHFMLKEIYEQKDAIGRTVESLRLLKPLLWDQLGVTTDAIYNTKKICLVGCGTSWHAARIAQFFFEKISVVPVTVCLASEFRYMPLFAEKDTLYLFISQSGETADTLEALRLVKKQVVNAVTIVLTNVATSTMVREAGGFLLTQAGIEVAVASTKAFSTQLTVLYWLAHFIAFEKKMITVQALEQAEDDLLLTANILKTNLENYRYVIESVHAPRYAIDDKAIFLGRHSSYPFAMESALKLKEVAYVFAQCYPAGELKHGPIALIDSQIPVYIFSHNDPIIYQKLLSNAHEVRARGGRVIAFAYEGQDELCSLAETYFIISGSVPPLLGSLAMTGLMQFFVYAVAKERGCSIDKPRNLAKSVTVE